MGVGVSHCSPKKCGGCHGQDTNREKIEKEKFRRTSRQSDPKEIKYDREKCSNGSLIQQSRTHKYNKREQIKVQSKHHPEDTTTEQEPQSLTISYDDDDMLHLSFSNSESYLISSMKVCKIYILCIVSISCNLCIYS